MKKWFRMLLFAALACCSSMANAQIQSCPDNINFSNGTLLNWSAATGLVGGASTAYPAPNASVNTLPEYSMQTTGIRVNTAVSQDHFGKFPTIPVINGYGYNYSIQLGSSSTSHDLNSGVPNPGGFVRSVTYVINVPAGPSTVPYTMTYAYALVLENGTHNSNEQPLFKATLKTQNGIITCASPQYYLPTLNNGSVGGGGGSATGATLDTAAALANGFVNSPELFLSYAGQAGNNGTWLRDVWTKDWTEVTFDLSPYRGSQVTLTFETDNCTPGAHFAYAYVALRNTCAGLEISGPKVACTNSTLTYSIPALAGATYNWTIPAGWTFVSGSNSNTIQVVAGSTGGQIIAHQVNGCADLRDTIDVTTTPPTVAGAVVNNNTVCTGANSTLLTSTGAVGNVINWISSVNNGTTWTPLNITSGQYNAQNLTQTTQYAALIQNGSTCRIDTSQSATITVNEKTKPGNLQSSNSNVCLGEPNLPMLTLLNNNGTILNWQQSADGLAWNSFVPTYQQSQYQPASVNATTYYRVVVQNGVCPADTSSVATLRYFNVPYPVATLQPDSSFICYGKSATLNATINTGTSYSWSNPSIVSGGNGTVPAVPYSFTATATPRQTTNLVLSVLNAGCPNPLHDTAYIHVTAPIIVFAGNDTAVVVNQSLQFNATVNTPEANQFTWNPSTYLNNPTIPNPVGLYSSSAPNTITYVVTATTPAGCQGMDNITVTIFKTDADIFMPSGFTPNDDGTNDFFTPICVGIQKLNYFRVFNRWGQLVFSSSTIGQGWDGKIKGAPQSTANFVYMVQGVDYTGRTITKKGNLMLIR